MLSFCPARFVEILNLSSGLNSIIDDPNDLTIPALVRASLHGTGDTDDDQSEFHIITGEVLYSILTSSTGESDALSHPSRKKLPSPQVLLHKILKGSSGSIDALFDKFAWYLTWLKVEQIYNCVNLVDTVVNLTKAVKTSYHRFLRNEPIWRELIGVLKKVNATRGMEVVEHGFKKGDRLAALVFDMMLGGLRYGKHENQDEYEPFVTLLMKSEVIESLDVFLPSLVARHDSAKVMVNFSGT